MHRALVIDNKLCYQRDVERKQMIHRKKLETMKSTAKSNSHHQMDNNRPKRHKHLEQNAKRRQLEDEHYAKIERENRILIEKMYSIMNSKAKPNAMEFQPGMRLNSNQGPMVDCYLSPRSNFPGHAVPHKSLNTESRRREHNKIMDENMQILKRLQEKKPVYSTKQLMKDRKMNESYMKNISGSTTTGYLPSPRSGLSSGSHMSWGASGFGSVSAGADRSDAASVLVPAKLAPIRPKGKKRSGKKSAREVKLRRSGGDDKQQSEQDTAAAKLQAVVRGRETRKSLAEVKGSTSEHSATLEKDVAASKLQAVQGNKLAQAAKEKEEADSAATKLQAIQRGKRTRQENGKREANSAATKLQAVQRGKKVRMDKGRKDENVAATKLQAVQRGKKARLQKKELDEKSKAATLLQSRQRSHIAHVKVKQLKEEKNQHEAATKIQAINRRKRTQAQTQEMKDQKDAAVKIQALNRRKTAMQKVENLKKKATHELLHKSGQKIGTKFCIVEVFKKPDQAVYLLVRASSPKDEFVLECTVDDEAILKKIGDDYESISHFLTFDNDEQPKVVSLTME